MLDGLFDNEDVWEELPNWASTSRQQGQQGSAGSGITYRNRVGKCFAGLQNQYV